MNDTIDTGGQKKAWWASALMIGGVISLLCLPIGALGSRVGLWTFELGIPLLSIGVVLAVIVLVLGIAALIFITVRKQTAQRNPVVIGVVLSVLVLALMGSQFMTAVSVPPIHNISTDTQNPPAFDKLVAVRQADGKTNPLEYNAEELAPQQLAAYPQVKPLISQAPVSDMFSRAHKALEDMGLEVVNADATAGILEATDTTFWFGFKDDVVVRVRAEGTGSIVDVRSVSRVGQSDLGKNAARIMDLMSRL